MSIRRKLLILLLSITLIPLLLIVVMYQISINYISGNVSDDIFEALDETARYNMQRMLAEYDKALRGNARMLEVMLQLQVAEVEKSLSGNIKNVSASQNLTFAKVERFEKVPPYVHEYKRVNQEGSEEEIKVNFQEQDYVLPAKVSYNAFSKDLGRLARMTEVYYSQFQTNPEMIYWLHTSLETGLHTSYPAGASFPPQYDPRLRPWYTQTIATRSINWSDPYIDALTGKPMITISAPIFRSNGALAGVTSLDISLTTVFQWMDLNPNWSENAEGFLIYYDDQSDEARIFASMNYEKGEDFWNKPLKFETILSEDSTAFATVTMEMIAGNSGVQKMLFKGVETLWIYQGITGKVVYPLVLIPYDNVVALSEETEQYILRKNLEGLSYVAVLIALAILAIIFMSLRSAKKFTRPIHELATAGKKLGEGDFDAQVEINTGDEIQQLGEVFNEIGPKLDEHQKMQQSLELARTIQQRLLPKSAPHLENFDIAGLCQYSDETGGDYYDFVSLDESGSGKVSVILGDVTGHGIGAALLMASARSMLRNNLRHYGYDPSKVLYEFNNELSRDTDPDKFITLFMGIIEDEQRQISWTLGGHDPAIWFQQQAGKFEELSSVGVPIGFVPDMNFEKAGPVTLQSGDVVVIGTDGIWEASDESGEMFGKNRLMEVIKIHSGKSAEEIGQEIIQAVLEFCQPHHQEDDITVVVVKAL
jgi:sigma-B regulation protein RsbU (phosphoserine phosphatase)